MGNWPFRITQVAEYSLLVSFQGSVGAGLSQHIARCREAASAHFKSNIINTVPSYNALLMTFQPAATGNIQKEAEQILRSISGKIDIQPRKPTVIPVWYDIEVAEYLEKILEATSCSLHELIRLHTGQTFFVYMMGFCPGFAYMGDLPDTLRLPRRATPKLKIPAGSVAIADFQTAVYPLVMPGGWHIIGRTPLTVFDAGRQQPSLFEQGDLVKFKAISKDTFLQQGGVL